MSGFSGGSDKIHYVKNHSIRQIVGDRMPITSERYVGSSTANPTDLTYFGVAASSSFGSTLSDGVIYKLRLTQRIEFFDRKNVDDVSSLLIKTQKEQEEKRESEMREARMKQLEEELKKLKN